MHVAKSQAGAAQKLFDQYGVQVENPYQGKSSARPPGQSQTHTRRSMGNPPSRKSGGPFSVFNIFDT
jgi:hypothetical protein